MLTHKNVQALRNYVMFEQLTGQLAKLTTKPMDAAAREGAVITINRFAEQVRQCRITTIMLKAVQDLVKTDTSPSVIYHAMLGIWPVLYKELEDAHTHNARP